MSLGVFGKFFGGDLATIPVLGSGLLMGSVYAHFARNLCFGSDQSPRELLWSTRLVIFVLMMATVFMGSVLLWGPTLLRPRPFFTLG